MIATGILGVASAQAAPTPYTANDVVVYSVADGATASAAGASAAGAVSLDEFAADTDGTAQAAPVSSLTFPITAATAPSTQYALTGSGTGNSEGQLTLSGDGSCLLATGYDATAGTKKVSGTAAATTPRTIAEVTADGSYDTTTALTDFSDANNPRSATAQSCGKGSAIYVGGAAGGVRRTTLGATTSTVVTDTSNYKNVREVQVVDGQLYASADPGKNASPITIATVGSGLPSATDTGLVPADLPFADQAGTTTSEAPLEPYGYCLLQLSASSGGVDTLYVADNGLQVSGETGTGAIVKYYLDPSDDQWTQEGAVALAGVVGLTARDVNDSGTVDVYATTSAGGANPVDSSDGGLYELTDAAGFGEPLTGTPSLIYTAPVGTELRGIAFAPGTNVGSGGGTGSGAGNGTPPVITITPAQNGLSAALGDPTNPTLPLTVHDSDGAGGNLSLAVTASSDATVAATGDITLAQDGSGDWTMSVSPQASGDTSITLTATDDDGNTSTYSVPYEVSPATAPSDRYYTGAGNASTEISVGGGYFISGDDLSDVLRLYDSADSGAPVTTWDFTGDDSSGDPQLPDGAQSIDIEAAAETTDPSGDKIIYWLGSQSSSTGGSARAAADTLFATRVTGSGADTQLTYLGSYLGLRDDLIAWDHANGDPLGFDTATESTTDSKSAGGFNIEGLEFAPGSATTAYLAFRAPLEDPYSTGTDALLVPVENLPGLIGATTAPSDEFGAAFTMNLGGLGIREIRKNADNQYLIIAGTSNGDNDDFQLFTWDGQPPDAPVQTLTSVPQVADGAWEGIVSVPDPLVDGSPVELVEDNGDTSWTGGLTAKSGLATGLQKDLGRTFTISLPPVVTTTAPPTTPTSPTTPTTTAPPTTTTSAPPTSTATPRITTPPAAVGRPVVTFNASKLVVAGNGRSLLLPIRCGTATCSGTLTLTAAVRVEVNGRAVNRHQILGTVQYRVSAGHRRTVEIKLNRAGRALVAKGGRVELIETAKGGRRRTVTVTLHARSRSRSGSGARLGVGQGLGDGAAGGLARRG